MSQPMDNDRQSLRVSSAAQVTLDNYNHFTARYHNPYANYPPNMTLLPPSMHTPEAYLSSHLGSTNTNPYANNQNQNTASTTPAPNHAVANSALTTSAGTPVPGSAAAQQQPYPPSTTGIPCTLCGTSWPTYAELMQHMSHRHADYTGNYPFVNQYAQHNSMFQSAPPNTQPPSYFSYLLSQQPSLMQQPSSTNNPAPAAHEQHPKHLGHLSTQSTPQSTPYSPQHLTPLNPSIFPGPPSVSVAPPSENNLTKLAAPEAGRPSAQKNIECRICNVFCCTQDQLDIHFSGHKHKKRALIYNEFVKASHSFDQHTISKTGPNNWYCAHCRAAMDSMNSVLQHLESVKHRRFFGPSNITPSKHPDNADKDMNRVHGTSMSLGPKPLQVQVPNTGIVAPFVQSSRAAALSSNQIAEVTTVPPMTSPSSVQNDVLKGLKALSANKISYPGPMPVISKTRITEANPMNVAAAKIAGTTAAAHGTASLSCNACNVTCNSTESLVMHLASTRHKRRMASQPGTKIKPNPIVVSQVANTGPQSTPTEANGRSAGGTQIANASPTRPDVDMFCEVCRVPICGRRNYEDHVRGRLHLKNLNLKKVADAAIQIPIVQAQQEQRPTSSLSSTTRGATDRNDGDRDNTGSVHPQTQENEEISPKAPTTTELQQEIHAVTRNSVRQSDQEASNAVPLGEGCGSSNKQQKEGDSGTTDSTNGLAQLAAVAQAARKAPVRRKRASSSSRTAVEKSGASSQKENAGTSEKTTSSSPNRSGRRNSTGERGIKNSRGALEMTSSQNNDDDNVDERATK